jgi:hypothetical protein
MAKWGDGQQGANLNGRKKGALGGRMQALLCLDKMLARRKTQATLIRALDDEFKKNPIGFFKNIVMPLLPKEAKLTVDADGVMEWKSMLAPGGPAAMVSQAPGACKVIDVGSQDTGGEE